MTKIEKNWILSLVAIATLVACTTLCFSTPAFSQERSQVTYHTPVPADKLGLGVFIGNLTGVTMKKNMGANNSIMGTLGRSVGQEHSIVTLAFGWTLMHGLSRGGFLSRLSPYIGFGPGLKLRDSSAVTDQNKRYSIFAQIPVGVEWNPAESPVGIFTELGTSIDVQPDVKAHNEVGAGARVYF
ncbi:MAG: hypothetical protein AB7F43_09580 [Bacteriovoracia bacterium]